ncbi:M56 family metallopeptidase [Flavobacterium sp. 245]|uniref:M56 family metallopeptidase n=1 Tax=Flavobacterium sp. 245 TaxID=2512115 RepID=UPI0010600FCD|nr:M56 family metallopeptidase [Flavobacterium sp. 245]TDP02880.1 beta-lactamase regulating signal transducer with metallopeptidase domain [Flavobacterium sp. 245]
MEALFIYIAKSAGLVVMFYCVYHFLLRKETFFNTNRWFLLAGLGTSALLPLLVYTKTIFVQPTPVSNFELGQVSLSQNISQNISNQSFEVNWNYILLVIYGLGFLVLFIKFALDFYSLQSVLKGKKIKQQADFKFIDTTENIAPFSYFEYIVYNSSMYTSSELENIIEHEKVHSDQNHTADILIARIFCLLFWFNPVIWLYKKAIAQNLEFIADKEAAKKLSDKRAYQYTLLKITTHESCIAITNHFYQSLIKKRIVMLNKNQSRKRNSWKYYVVIPALVSFVLLFQIEVIAKERQQASRNEVSKTGNSVDVYKISKKVTDQELKEIAENLKKKHDVKASISDVERNSNNELTSIKVEVQKGSQQNQTFMVRGSKAIKDCQIIVTTEDDGSIKIDFLSENQENQVKVVNKERKVEVKNVQNSKIDCDVKTTDNTHTSVTTSSNANTNATNVSVNTNESVSVSVNSNSKPSNRVMIFTNSNDSNKLIIEQKPLIIINGTIASPDFNISDIDQKKISTVTTLLGKSAEDKYGDIAKNGVVEITTKTTFGKSQFEDLQGKVVKGHPTN